MVLCLIRIGLQLLHQLLMLLLVLRLVMLLEAPFELVSFIVGAEHAFENVWGFLFFVDVQVLFQVTSASKSLFAESAFIWLLPCVNALMPFHIAHLTELFTTSWEWTIKRFLLSVGPVVQLEDVLAWKLFVADITLVLPIRKMSSVVLPESEFCFENHLAWIMLTLIDHYNI